MSYNTYLHGMFEFDKPLTDEHRDAINAYADLEHRDSTGGCAPGMPGIHCPFYVTEDGKFIESVECYDDGYLTWIQHIVNKFLTPWGYSLNGEMVWDGDEPDDSGTLTVTNNVVTSISITEQILATERRAAEMEEGLDKLLSLVPDQLPLLMGINPTMDEKVKALLKGLPKED